MTLEPWLNMLEYITYEYVQHALVLVRIIFFPVLAIMDLSDQ